MIQMDVVWHQKTFESVLTNLQKMWKDGIDGLENLSMYCAENGEINNEMDGMEGIDLCSVSQTKNDTVAREMEVQSKNVRTKRKLMQLE